MACKVVSESMACNTGVVANKTKKLRTDIQETVQEHQEQVGNLTSACTAKSSTLLCIYLHDLSAPLSYTSDWPSTPYDWP